MDLLPEKDMGLGIYPLYFDQLTNLPFHSYYSGHSYKWLDMNYFYMFQYDNSLGAPPGLQIPAMYILVFMNLYHLEKERNLKKKLGIEKLNKPLNLLVWKNGMV